MVKIRQLVMTEHVSNLTMVVTGIALFDFEGRLKEVIEARLLLGGRELFPY